MYPDTIVVWHDQSGIQTPQEPDYYANAPLYLCASSFDRGPEKMQVVYGENFYKLYGNKMNFAKHGQPALQAANCIDGGAKLLLKRIVAPDSLLANVVLCPTITRTRIATVAEDPMDPNAVTREEACEILNGVTYTPSVRRVDPVQHAISESRAVSRSVFNGETYDLTMDTVLDTENTPILPDKTTGLQQISLESEPGTYDGYTVLTVSPYRNATNTYLYKLIPDGEQPTFPALTEKCELDTNGGDWKLWDEREIKVPEGIRYIVIVECQEDHRDPSDISYLAVGAGAVRTKAKEETMYIIQDSSLVLKWEAISVTGCKTHDDVVAMASTYRSTLDTLEEDEDGSLVATVSKTFPLISISDNGRGVSTKSVKFTPDYVVSRASTNMFYTLEIYDGSTRLDKQTKTINPYCIIDNKSYGLTNDTSDQIIIDFDDVAYDEYFTFIKDTLSLSEDELRKHDILFATTNVGNMIPGFELDEESIDLNSAFGIELQNGSNGSFENAPFGTDDYIEQMVSFFEGEEDDSIWDVDLYKIHGVFDANYPDAVKDSILKFVEFREDCAYFRDYGIEVFSYFSIYEKAKTYQSEFKVNRFTIDYYTTYQIYDPETKRRIRVTMMYDFARAMIDHFRNSFARPIAGIANNMVLPSAIPGTINFTPRKTPKVNQKRLLDDLRVNYAIFNNEDQCVVNTLYSSQLEYTQLSYANNVLAIQQVIRILRNTCPKVRYTFVTGNDFSEYEKAVTNVLKQINDEFEELRFEYEQDELLAAQKIFYASIYFRFRNWAQTEQFDLYALPVSINE